MKARMTSYDKTIPIELLHKHKQHLWARSPEQRRFMKRHWNVRRRRYGKIVVDQFDWTEK